MNMKKILGIMGCCLLWCMIAQAQYRPKRILYPIHSLEAHVAPAYNRLAYHLGRYQSQGAWDPAWGMSYQCQLNRYVALAFTVDHRRYFGEINLENHHDSVHLDDGYGELYVLHLILNNTEKQVFQAIDFSVRAQGILPITSWLDGLFEFGLSYGMRYREASRMSSGSIQKYAYFYEHHTLIDDLPLMNLGRYNDYVNPLSEPLFRNSWMARAGLGLRFHLTSHWGVQAIAVVHYGLSNIQAQSIQLNQHDSYSGVASSQISGGVRPLSLGVEAGVFYRFVKYETYPKRKYRR